MLITIDPGHGGKDPGTIAHGLEEEDFNLIISSIVSMQLLSIGHDVLQTRAYDENISLEYRVNLANSKMANLFVSIHANAAENTKANGIEIFYISDKGKCLAKNVLDSMCEEFPNEISRGIKQQRFYVLTKTLMPAILVECGFISNPNSMKLLKDEEYQVRMATAISRGINDYIFGGYYD